LSEALVEEKVCHQAEKWTSGRSYRRKLGMAEWIILSHRPRFPNYPYNFTRMGRGETNTKVGFMNANVLL
jgi:hypothetical protein